MPHSTSMVEPNVFPDEVELTDYPAFLNLALCSHSKRLATNKTPSLFYSIDRMSPRATMKSVIFPP